ALEAASALLAPRLPPAWFLPPLALRPWWVLASLLPSPVRLAWLRSTGLARDPVWFRIRRERLALLRRPGSFRRQLVLAPEKSQRLQIPELAPESRRALALALRRPERRLVQRPARW